MKPGPTAHRPVVAAFGLATGLLAAQALVDLGTVTRVVWALAVLAAAGVVAFAPSRPMVPAVVAAAAVVSDVALGVHGPGAAFMVGAVAIASGRAGPWHKTSIALAVVHALVAALTVVSPGLDPSAFTPSWPMAALTAGAVAAAVVFGAMQRRELERARLASEEVIDQLEAELADAGPVRLSFSALSHEIRTRLASVTGMATLLRDDKLPPGIAERVDFLHHSADALQRFVSDIIDLGQTNAGARPFESKSFDLQRLAEEVIALASATMHGSVRLVSTVDPGMETDRVGDAARVRQICLHLLYNAITLTDTGTVTLKIDAAAGDDVRFTVTDTGRGMDDAAAQALFGARDPSTTPGRRLARRGGLAVVRELVEGMGGRPNVHSTVGEGSAFGFTLALPRSIETGPATLPRGDSSLDGLRVLEGLRALVADDNPINRMVAVGFLGREGAISTQVENGLEVLESLRNAEYDVVLLDIEMPAMGGFEATEILRGEGHAVPIIGLTAHAGDEFRQRCMEAGMNAHLAKPYRAPDLIAEILRVIS